MRAQVPAQRSAGTSALNKQSNVLVNACFSQLFGPLHEFLRAEACLLVCYRNATEILHSCSGSALASQKALEPYKAALREKHLLEESTPADPERA